MIAVSTRRILALMLVLSVVLVSVAPTQAQSGGFVCSDTTASLDCTVLEQAARPLLARGAQVALFLQREGDATGDDALSQLRSIGLSDGTIINPALLMIYVSLSPRYAELRAGDNWQAGLDAHALDSIRSEVLTPALRSGDFTGGFVATLAAFDQRLSNTSRLAISTAPPAASQPLNLPIATIVALLLGGGGYAIWRSLNQRRRLADQHWYVNDKRERVEDLLQELVARLQMEQEHATSDAQQYAPADVERLEQQRKWADARLQEAQASFGLITRVYHAKEQRSELLEQMRTDLDQLMSQAERITAQFDTLTHERAALTRSNEQATAARAALASRLGAARQALATAAIGPDAALALAPLDPAIDELDQLLGQHQAEHARTRCAELTSQIEAICQHAGVLASTRDQIMATSEQLAVLEALHQPTASSNAALQEAQQHYQHAIRAFAISGDSATPLAASQQALSLAYASGVGQLEGRPVLQKLLELGLRARQVVQLVEQARIDFDLVDEYAERCWIDIRGNGSQAERLLGRAHATWEQASQQHTNGDQPELEPIAADLEQATILAQAIRSRLADLERCRAIANQELDAATTDLATAQAFLAANDADIGPQPEQQLAEAVTHLEQARHEAALERPDWIALVRQAQAANALADQALAGARSEYEAFESLRRQVGAAQQVAQAEVSRAVNYFDSHRSDIGWTTSGRLNELRDDLRDADSRARQASEQAEAQRRAALETALAGYRSIDSSANSVFQSMYREVSQADQWRAEAEQREARDSGSIWGSRSSRSSDWGAGGSSGGSSWGSSWGAGGSSGGSQHSSGGSSGGSSWGSGSKSGGSW